MKRLHGHHTKCGTCIRVAIFIVVAVCWGNVTSVWLSAAGVQHQLAASPTDISFGNVTVGSSITQTITLTNPGMGKVTITQIDLTGTGFSVNGVTLPTAVAKGQSITLTAIFSPTVAGSVAGSISIVSNASNSPMVISLSGTGVTLSLSVSPTTVDLGNVTVGSSNSQTISIVNLGTGSVTITQANITGTGFSISGLSLPLTTSSGGSAVFDTVFSPTATGSDSGAIALISDATNSPNHISLTGYGVNTHSTVLSWAPSTSPNISGYNVYRGTVSGGPYTALTSSIVSGTTYTDATPQAGQTYYYVVTAVSSSGLESGYSNQVEAVVPSP